MSNYLFISFAYKMDRFTFFNERAHLFILFVENTVFGNSLDYLAVDLEGSGSIELDRYLLARADVDEFFVLDVLALEEGGEDQERAERAQIVENANRNDAFSVQSFLRRAGHHTAAEKLYNELTTVL